MRKPHPTPHSNLEALILQFAKFSGVGAIGTVGHYLTLIFLVQILGFPPVIGSTCGFIVGALINYYLNYTYTFASNKSHREAMTKFFVVAFLGMCLNAAIMFAGIYYLQMNYILSQIIATGIVLTSNFAFNRLWTFSETEGTQ